MTLWTRWKKIHRRLALLALLPIIISFFAEFFSSLGMTNIILNWFILRPSGWYYVDIVFLASFNIIASYCLIVFLVERLPRMLSDLYQWYREQWDTGVTE